MRENISLKEIGFDDLDCFNDTEYSALTEEKRKELVEHSKNSQHQGKYFKFYLIIYQERIVGFLNVCDLSRSAFSIAPEIKKEFRRKGFCEIALTIAFNIQKLRGKKLAIASIREDNVASIKLHEKLGFELVKDYYSKSGKPMKEYVKFI